MKKTLEDNLSEVYISNMDIIGEGLPPAVNSARRGFLESFNLLSLPSRKDERYRHCDLRELFDRDWEYYFTPMGGGNTQSVPLDGYAMNLVDGFYGDGTAYCELPDGVVYGSLKAALNNSAEAARHYNSVADNEAEAVTALNSVFMQDGAFIYVPRGVKAQKPFVVNLEYRSAEQAQMCFGRMLVVVEEGAEAEIVVAHKSADGANVLVDFVRESVVARGGVLHVSEVSDFNDESYLVVNNYMSQADDSRTRSLNVWLGGGVSRMNSAADLRGRGGEMTHNALYFGRGEQRCDVNLNVNHLVPDCTSNQLVKGVVSGNSVGAFTGRVLVAQDAQRTAAFQQSRNLQLSDTAKIYTEPQLEIYADDVKCSHGATVGQMNDEAVYYMRQRGISEVDARKLQLFGFVNDVITGCENPEVCEYIGRLAEERIVGL